MTLQENVPHPPGTNDLSFHRKQFLAERIGWCAMAVVLAWALLGGFGEGWLSNQAISNDEETVQLKYQRFARRDSPTELRLRVRRLISGQSLLIHLDPEFVDGVKIERVTPQYKSMILKSDGATMVFDIEPDGQDFAILLEYKPRRMGSLHVAIRAAANKALAFEQFVYP